ncbi:CorA family divalent cation transporter [Culturomica massiliensis]|uniref:CorA family divalent cation transporter n=1 Tax=Culturomica massiliensis TaxID=1841857 RepID=UPI000A5231A8|nr:CorA family divalent cation transporter [Culturomica massiliensis]
MKIKIFLLGGYDLEMMEIAVLLEQQGICFFDRHLNWEKAVLSAYREELEKYGNQPETTIFGVELQDDGIASRYTNYVRIDHHGDYSGRPSSLEQVAALLEYPLTRWQFLVAANDSEYIPGMLKRGAVREEIDRIRREDRAAQGVTPNEEQLAERAIAENLEEYANLKIVRAFSDRFSPICDRLWPYESLLVYTDETLCYYGKRTDKLIDIYIKDKIQPPPLYYGGGPSGYIGTKGKWDVERILRLKRQIIKYITVNSYHIFYFPFKWDVLGREYATFSEEVNLGQIQPQSYSEWEANSEPDEQEKQELYNEKNYYFEFVHPVLYDSTNENTLLKHYERKEPKYKKVFYHIDITKDKGEVKSRRFHYRLRVDSINLNFYSTGVGMLTFYLENTDYKEPQAILDINQYGRRIFPPFYADIEGRGEIAESIRIEGLEGEKFRYQEDFKGYRTDSTWCPGAFICNLISDLMQNLEITPVIDDRMFVNCWYGNDDVAKEFRIPGDLLEEIREKNKEEQQKKHFEKFLEKDFWYKYVFVDADFPCCSNGEMKAELLKMATYTRWQGTGSLYGVSRYSMVLLTDENLFAKDVLQVYMRTVYSRMIELVLVQRASMLRFSGEVTVLSQLTKENYRDNAIKIASLYKEYIRFVNQIFFRSVTSQEQGIELYQILGKQFQIEEQIEDLESEIGELHQYISLLIDSNRNEQGAHLNVLAALFLPATIITGFFGMNSIFQSEFEGRSLAIQVPILLMVTIGIYLWLKYRKTKL